MNVAAMQFVGGETEAEIMISWLLDLDIESEYLDNYPKGHYLADALMVRRDNGELWQIVRPGNWVVVDPRTREVSLENSKTFARKYEPVPL